MKRCAITFLFVQLLISAQGQYANPALRDTINKFDKLFTQWNTHTPGVAVRVSRNGILLYEKAFGMADLEHNVVNTPNTIFEAGSVSKQFTAAAALLLIKEGKLSLKDDIRKYFPELPDYGTPITVEHLFHHTSGLRDWGVIAEIGGWPRGTRIYTAAHVKDIIWRQTKLNFTPGAEYNYSNSNYNLLAFLVEKITGQSHQQFTSERLFKPIGMTNTKWRDNFREVIPNRAIAYSGFSNNYHQNMPFENTFGHGALLTTVGDLDKWNQRWRNNSLGADINEMQKTKTNLLSGQEITYAAGVVNDKFANKDEISHSGATAGYRSWLAYYPQSAISITVLSNYAGADVVALGRQIAEEFFGKSIASLPQYIPTSIDLKQYSTKAGVYRRIRGEDIQEFIFNSDSLRLKNRNTALIPMASNKFYTAEGFVISFPDPKSGSEYMLWQNSFGDTALYTKVRSWDAVTDLTSYTGTYISEEAETKMKLLMRDGKLEFFQSPDTYATLTPAYRDAFRTGPNLLEFERNKKKEITGFRLSAGRVRHLLFTKMK